MKDEDPALVKGAQVDHALIRIPGLVTNVMAWDIKSWIVLLAIGRKKTVVSTMNVIKWKITVWPIAILHNKQIPQTGNGRRKDRVDVQ